MVKFLLMLFVCLSSLLEAQESRTQAYGPFSQFRFSAMPAWYNSLTYQNVGAPWYRSGLGFGGEFVVSYGQTFWKGFGLNVGAGFGFVPYNFSMDMFHVPGSAFEEDDYPINTRQNNNMDYIFMCPILIEKKFVLVPEDNLFLNLEAGVKWNIRFHSFTSSRGSYRANSATGEQVTYFEYSFTSPDNPQFLSYVFKAGLLEINKRNNSFSGNLVFQYSPSSMLNGTYEFTNLGTESFGTTELHNTYIGFEIVYGLSLGK